MTPSVGGRRPTRDELAREAYAAALAVARARSTPASWRRLVRAGENLRAATRDARGFSRDILLVDEPTALRDALQGVLEDEGLRVVTAEHGPAALEVLKRRRVLPRAIVLDLGLPTSARELRRDLQRDPRLSSIPVIVMAETGELDGGPATRRLAKPVDPGALLAAVSRLP